MTCESFASGRDVPMAQVFLVERQGPLQIDLVRKLHEGLAVGLPYVQPRANFARHKACQGLWQAKGKCVARPDTFAAMLQRAGHNPFRISSRIVSNWPHHATRICEGNGLN